MQNNPQNWPELHERIAYTGGGWRRMILEGLLCGALTLTVASGLAYIEWPRTATIAIGGAVGFIGVDSLRAFALRFIGNRIGEKNDNE